MQPSIRALLGTTVFAVALGTAGAVDKALGGGNVIGALLCGGIAVPLIILLCKRIDRRPLSDLGITTPGFLIGLAVTAGTAALTFGTVTALGWVRWGSVDWLALLTFLVTNALLAFALEALPEELSFRGYVFQNLREGRAQGWAMVFTTALFMIAPALSSVVNAGISALLGGEVRTPTIAPVGEDPITYLLTLALFGYTLLVARVSTGSLWTSIALHLTFLSVNRIMLGRDTGWPVEILAPEALLAIPAYLVLTVLTFKFLDARRNAKLAA